jgi:hypothetical protein
MSNITLRPSGAHRWANCPGSVAFDAPQKENEWMIQGKIAHKLAELAIKAKCRPSELVGVQTVTIMTNGEAGEVEISLAVPDSVVPFVDEYYDDLMASAGDYPVMAETHIDIAGCVNGGTVDATILKDDGLEIHDLKFGRKEVEAQANEQLILYAAGMLDFVNSCFRDITEDFPVSLFIHQPLINRVDAWTTSAKAIKEKAEEFSIIADTIQMGGRALNPGEKQCKYCPGKAECGALSQSVCNSIADDFVDMSKPLPPAVIEGAVERTKHADLPSIGSMLSVLPLIEQWIDAVRERAKAELIAGRDVPGYKLVAGKRGGRKWIDEQAAEEKVKSMRLKKDDAYETLFMSPAKLEKSIGKEKFKKLAELITQAEGSPVIAETSDKRPALSIADVSGEFNIITPEED